MNPFAHTPARPAPMHLPVAECAACGTDVLLAVDLDEHEELVRVCARCATPIAADAPERLADEEELRALGFTPDELPGDGCGGGCGGKG